MHAQGLSATVRDEARLIFSHRIFDPDSGYFSHHDRPSAAQCSFPPQTEIAVLQWIGDGEDTDVAKCRDGSGFTFTRHAWLHPVVCAFIESWDAWKEEVNGYLRRKSVV